MPFVLRVWLMALFMLFGSSRLLGNSCIWINLYGHAVELTLDKPNIQLKTPYAKGEIAQQIIQLNAENLAKTVSQMDSISNVFGMDDMTYLVFAKKLCETLFAENQAKKIFLYQLLRQKGYHVILGYSDSSISVYANFESKIFDINYVIHKGLVYTDVDFDQKKVTNNEELFEEAIAGRTLLINENRPPYFNALKSAYNFHIEFEGFNYFFKGYLNQSLADYYRDLPDLDFGPIYLNYGFDALTQNELVQDIQKAMIGIPGYKKIDFLLSFSQDAIPYAGDKKMVGKEKFSFPEEVLANKYGDCEDKSVLFAYLVKTTLNLPSVALIYGSKNHLNVGVATNQNYRVSFTYQNQKYLVCEPSGDGFKPGDNIYDLAEAKIIKW